jgi:shikimate kinase
MKVVLIHGAPASGKLTVARVLAENHGFKLLHNHLAVDLSLSIYDEWGEKDFHDFTDSIRRVVLKKAKELGVKFLVMTWVVSSDTNKREIQRYLEFFDEEKITVLPVYLATSKSKLLERVVRKERRNSHKISSVKELTSYLDNRTFYPIKHADTFTIDNTSLSPEKVASLILGQLNTKCA